jgi:hypothetical protein
MWFSADQPPGLISTACRSFRLSCRLIVIWQAAMIDAATLRQSIDPQEIDRPFFN